MHYKLLFLFSVFLGILYDWISILYLDKINSVVFILIVYSMSLLIMTCIVFYKKFLRGRCMKTCLCLLLDIFLLIIPIFLFSYDYKYFFALAVFIIFLFRRKLTFNYMVIIRSILSIIGLIMIFSCFGTSNLSQITSSYYAIPLGDFVLTTLIYSRGYKFIIISILSCILLLFLVCKDFLVNWMSVYTMVGCIVSVLVFLLFIFKVSNKKRKRKSDIVHFFFIICSVVILFIYNAMPLAILGSVILSCADILMYKYADKDFFSETYSFFLCSVIVCFSILCFYSGELNMNWFAICTKVFPTTITDFQWLLFVLCSVISTINQFIWLICFSNRSLIQFIPLRYVDLFFTNILKKEFLLAAFSLGLSGSFLFLI